MEMKTAVTTALLKYATFRGRATRPDYWRWVLLFSMIQRGADGANRCG
jgi:uncharacterized membrane protein YhaH (DUF805 family)